MHIAKIDFIVCLEHGSWHFQSATVPVEIGCKSNEEIVKYVRGHGLIEDTTDVVAVFVYWRDPNIDKIV